jgi:integrase
MAEGRPPAPDLTARAVELTSAVGVVGAAPAPVSIAPLDIERIAMAVAGRIGPARAPTTATIATLCAAWCNSPEARALRAVKSELARAAHLRRLLGDVRASEISMLDVDGYRQRREGEGASPATRNREVVRLGAILRWAADRKVIPAYPLPRLKPEPERNERSTHLTDVDARRIVEVCPNEVIAAMVATGFDSGLRRAELCQLRRDQIDVTNGIITVYAGQTKAQRGRATVLSAWASDLIAALPPSPPWVFPSRFGRPYNPRTVLRLFQEAACAAGVVAAPGERVWLHDLRSGFADQQVEIGTSIADVMKMAGWRDFRTAQRYLRRQTGKIAADAARRLNGSRGPHTAPMSDKRKLGRQAKSS